MKKTITVKAWEDVSGDWFHITRDDGEGNDKTIKEIKKSRVYGKKGDHHLILIKGDK